MTTTGVDALTMRGRVVHIRQTTPDDGAGIKDLHARVSSHSRYLRFFSAGAAPESEVVRLTRPPDGNHLALVVEDAGQIVGVASYENVTPTKAEFAVLVDDARQGEGIGTLVLEHLAAAARRAGIDELLGDVLAANTAMLKVSGDFAPAVTRAVGEELGTMLVRMPTLPDEAALAAVGARDRTAEHRSLRPLLAPRSVAVVGAGRRAGGIGHAVLGSLVDGGYTGAIYPVNPRAGEIAGLRAFPSVTAIDAPVDLAIIAVPARHVNAVVADCAAAGVRAAVVLTSGLGETDADGAARQADLVRVARAHGMRVVGPNCLGVLNTDPAVRLTAAFAPSMPPAGGLAVASQSGAVGVAILDAAARTGTGISSFVSLGNKADVSGNDLLCYWYDDPATRAVALYLESFGNPRRFAWVARALSRRKPVLAVKSGRSIGGQRAGASHTAAAVLDRRARLPQNPLRPSPAVSSDVAVDSLFAQAGVIRTDTLGELLDAARVLVDQPLPAGSRLAIVGNAGGLNILAADAAEPAGLAVPGLSDRVLGELRDLAPGAAGVGNPVDLGAEATPAVLADAIAVLARSGEVDAVVATYVSTRTNDVVGAMAALAAAADDAPDLPMVAVVVGAPDAPVTLGARRVPVFALPEEAVRAMGRAASYAAWRRQPIGERPQLSGVDSHAARAIVARANPGWQPPDVARALLECYGIPVVDTAVASDMGAAVAAADRIGYPVAVKAASANLVHKSDIGAVRLNLGNAEAVRQAYIAIAIALGVDTPDVIVQPMAAPGVELVAGVLHDRHFGSLVMLGLGGVHTDLLGDRAFRLLPVTTLDAGRMWRSLRGAPLLTGYRGSPPVDTDALEDLLSRVGRLAEEHPEVAELDLNPVLAGPCGAVAVDVKLRLSTVDDEPDPYVRMLTQPQR
jgi:acyl-CoA synthetase (NDP forming)/GNAT superfamily N-acetyltransferase